MQNSLFQAICRMGIFMICAQAVIHFRPKEVYEKYLKLMVSVMVLIQVFLPIGNFLLGDGREDVLNALGQLGRELEQSMEEAGEDAAAADELLEKMTLEEIRKRLEEQEKEQNAEERDGERQEGGEDGEQGGKGRSGGQEGGEGQGVEGRDDGENREEGESEQDDQETGTKEIRLDDVEPVVIDPIRPIQSDSEED